jgi:hypothetical protein
MLLLDKNNSQVNFQGLVADKAAALGNTVQASPERSRAGSRMSTRLVAAMTCVRSQMQSLFEPPKRSTHLDVVLGGKAVHLTEELKHCALNLPVSARHHVASQPRLTMKLSALGKKHLKSYLKQKRSSVPGTSPRGHRPCRCRSAASLSNHSEWLCHL